MRERRYSALALLSSVTFARVDRQDEWEDPNGFPSAPSDDSPLSLLIAGPGKAAYLPRRRDPLTPGSCK